MAAQATRTGPFTLAIDIGGTNIKASVLDRDGALAADKVRAPTPKPATPAAVLESISVLVARLPRYDRISVGFPGVVKGGCVRTAANLGTKDWLDFNIIDALAGRFGAPVRVLNDAAVQGLGVVEGHGLECVITLGTGVGCALFRNRRLLLHLELGYDAYIGQAALAAIGLQAWNERVVESIRTVMSLTACDVIYVGGGNARVVTAALPPQVRIVSNTAGVTGGARLWEPVLDELFVGEPNAERRPDWEAAA
jgi:polyphosphate glucokinase